MAQADLGPDEALDMVEQAILPGLAMLIEDARSAAALTQPGESAEAYATELRRIARQIGGLAELLAGVTPQPGAESRERISA